MSEVRIRPNRGLRSSLAVLVRSGLHGCDLWRSSSLRPTPPQINYPKSQQCRAQEREGGGFGDVMGEDREIKRLQ